MELLVLLPWAATTNAIFDWPSFGTSFPCGSVWPRAEPTRPKTSYQGLAYCGGGKLISLNGQGLIHVWGLEDGRFDEDTSRPSSRGKQRPQTSRRTATTFGRRTRPRSIRGSQAERSWKPISEFHGDGQELEALVGVGGSPLLIFRTARLIADEPEPARKASMTTEDVLLRLANHANLPGERFPETESLVWVLWNADRRRLAPDLGRIGSDLLSCLEALKLRLNGPVPSTRIGIRENSNTIAEVAYSAGLKPSKQGWDIIAVGLVKPPSTKRDPRRVGGSASPRVVRLVPGVGGRHRRHS